MLAVDSPVRKLNPLLRLAAISGVETAIKLHIRRGDDLDASDRAGATPLILAAAKRRKGAVRLLLGAGANPTLADLSGMDALAHAIKGGCPETIAVLTEAMGCLAVSGSSDEPAEVTVEPIVDEVESIRAVEPEDTPQMVESPCLDDRPVSVDVHQADSAPDDEELTMPAKDSSLVPEKISSDAVTEVAPTDEPNVLMLDDEPLNDLVADDWEAEEEIFAPEGDETVAEAARRVHEAIGRHKVVDRDEDWGDVDLHLPVRAAPLTRDEGGGTVRDLLLAALREGLVSEDRLIDVCSNADGNRNEEAERLLAFVAGELGATVVEWTGSDEAPFLSDASMEEDRLLSEAAEFAEELASGRNDPFRFYAKDIRGDLLDAEEEIALGREMEEAGRSALSALASWPEGLSAVFEAADRVARGEADAESFCAGPEPSSDEESVSKSTGTEEDEDDESELDEEAAFFVNAVAALKTCRGDARRAAEVLEEARLTRGFLMELADKAVREKVGRDFVEALGRQAKARERMILCNLRLALSIAKKHLWSGMPFDDLVQEANIGLMKAVERYDWRRGFRFSTYATWWIRQQVSRSIADTARVVRAPVHIQETARKILRERESVEARLGRPETVSETARRIGTSLAKTRMLLAMFDDVASLDEAEPDSGLSRVESLVDERTSDPADIAERASLRGTLLGMLEDLDERAREVILLRFGLMDDDAMTLDEVGQHFGVTRERIRQIESKTMRRLSHPNKRDILRPFMGERYAPRRSPSPDRMKAEASSASDEKVALEEDNQEFLAPVVEREAPSFPSPRPKPEAPRVAKPIPVRGADRALTHEAVPLMPATALADDRTSRIADEARALGLSVEDRRAQGGELRIVAPFASPQNIRAFGRRLLASGFRKIQRDVFAK
ncbi:RNA polymerase primary sigma factor [Azonexus fungiphilus]|uniref:RNA polymerase primary sigma factor n=1 Tax=Azonexus fungiphilus TaxID=146940 RepID=A0A495VK63_9RHOO|nr:RNA polymerase primary sigma factor [Azonexus fungiphilus]